MLNPRSLFILVAMLTAIFFLPTPKAAAQRPTDETQISDALIDTAKAAQAKQKDDSPESSFCCLSGAASDSRPPIG